MLSRRQVYLAKRFTMNPEKVFGIAWWLGLLGPSIGMLVSSDCSLVSPGRRVEHPFAHEVRAHEGPARGPPPFSAAVAARCIRESGLSRRRHNGSRALSPTDRRPAPGSNPRVVLFVNPTPTPVPRDATHAADELRDAGRSASIPR